MIYWFRKHRISDDDVTGRKYGQQHQVGWLREGQEARDADCGAGVVTVELGTGERLELEFVVLASRDGEEGVYLRSSRRGLVWRP